MKRFLIITLMSLFLLSSSVFATTIYDVQYTADPGSGSTYPSPYADQEVTVTGIVTAVGYNVYNDNIWISMPEGGAWKGIYVFSAGDTTLVLGDEIEVTGTVSEYYGFTEISGNSDPITINLLSSGNPIPDPNSVTCLDLMTAPTAEPYEGTLVELNNATVIDTADPYGQWYVDDGTGIAQIDDEFFYLDSVDPPIVIEVGQQWNKIAGCLDYSYSEYGINPRIPSDLQLENIVADFVANLTTGYYPLTVEFTDQSTPAYLIIAWEWDFQNDGTIDSYDQNPIHTYQNAGSYSVSLTVTDESDSTDTIIKEDYIYVEEGNTIDGYAYLDNQTQHDSIEVYFEMQAPDDSTYTVYTDNSGYYSLGVAGGFYDITYSKDGYYSENLYGKNLFSNTTLNDITLIEHTTTINVPAQFDSIQTAIDNAWEGDTVLVDTGTYVENINFNGKNITVASMFLTTQDTSYISQTVIDGDSSGTVVTFDSGEDSTAIFTGFTITNGSNDEGGGIYCNNNSNTSLENLNVSNNLAYESGGGIYCSSSNPSLNNVTISNNTAYSGGGIYCSSSSHSLENVTITNNSANYGGGIWCQAYSSPSLVEVEITGNSADIGGGGIYCDWYSSPSLKNVTISGNSADDGGGIYCRSNSNPSLENISISNNTAAYDGGGIYCDDNSSPSLVNVTISNNTAVSYGGGIYCFDNSSPSLMNVTISNNTAYSGGGIYCKNNSSPSLVNTIVSNNIGDYGIYVQSGDPSIEYCDFYDNENGNFYGCDQYIGQIVTTNINGDSCDAYSNIQENPLFADTAVGNYHLTEDSPCIDAGDPDSPLDPDGTIADMGAYYYNQGAGVGDEPENIAENSFISYPNPIRNKSNEINIKFSLKKSSKVNIKLYNIKGQVVTEIFNDNKPSGTHTISSNLNNLASGIYFIKMDVDGKNIAVKKMIKIE